MSRTAQNRWSPVLICCALLLTFLGGSSTALAKAADASRSAQSRPPLVVVTSLGHVDASTMRLACRSLLETLPIRCELRGQEPEEDYKHAWSETRGQLDAREVLEQIFRRRSVDAHVELMLTDFDIYEGERPYVFGLGSLTDRVAVISTARIGGN